MADTIVPTTLPIYFSKVCEVVNQDLAGTNGRHLFGTGGQFDIATGTFDPTYVGSKDRLSNFRGYHVGDTTPPAVPTGVTLHLFPNDVYDTDGDGSDNEYITWNPVGDVDLAGYELRVKLDGIVLTAETRDYPPASYVGVGFYQDYLNTVYGGGTYCWSVRSYDTSGNYSAWSGDTCRTVITDTTAPSVPTGMDAIQYNVHSSDVTVSWNASTDNVAVTGYILERKVNSGVWVTIYTGSNLSFVDVGGIDGNTHYYKVAAYDAASNMSAYSAETNILITVL